MEHNLIRATQIPEEWNCLELLVVKYVDDVLGAEKIYCRAGKLHSSTRKQTSTVHAQHSETLINAITEKAACLGLNVNAKKTQMVCLNSSSTLEVSTFIRGNDNTKVYSGEKMKILGFYFDSRPLVHRHVEELKTKFRKRLWMLRNLKSSRAGKKDLLDCYLCFIRPVLDYCSNVYHPMFNSDLTNQLEKLQTSALKIIFGYGKEREELLEEAGISSLKE